MIANDECGEAAWAGVRDGAAYVLAPAGLTASEQMFFMGAPLAHVVRYEHELRIERDRRGRLFRTMPIGPARDRTLWRF